jgi:Na+-driven multidrug efflux pump
MQPRTDPLGHHSIDRLLLTYSAPAMFAMLVSSMYNLADTIFIGHGAGTLALAGLALSFPVQIIVMAVGMAVGIGSASVVSRALGSGDRAAGGADGGHLVFRLRRRWAWRWSRRG